MFHQPTRRATSLFAAVAYLLAIALSSVSHVHVHPHADHNSGTHRHSGTDEHQHCSATEHDHHGHEGSESASESSESPLAPEDDCQICQFLGRPLLAVTFFVLAETSERIVPLAAASAPEVQPIVLVATQARAPPSAAHTL